MSNIKKGDLIEVEIKKLVFGGEGLGEFQGEKIFAFNALPEELVKVRVDKIKRNFIRGQAVEILKKSAFRVEPKDNNFLASSPWQILVPEKELFWKKEILKEVFKKIAKIDLPDFEIKTDGRNFNYRNKMEFNFLEDEGKIFPACHERFSFQKMIAIEQSPLALGSLNDFLTRTIDFLNKNKVKAQELKSIILRSNQKGEAIAGLFVKALDFPKLNFGEILEGDLKGFAVYFSNPNSSATTFDKIIYRFGEEFLKEEILKKSFYFSLESFFQVNLPVFEMALEKIKEFAESGESVLDFYAGAGTIGFSLAEKIKEGVSVESEKSAIELMKKNLKENKISNFKIIFKKAEKAIDLIESQKTLLLDPPRAGCHPKVVKKILEQLPIKIIYLSCNPATQARDLFLLKEKYKIKFFEAYNFFPRTPHIESLAILKR